MTSYYFRSKKHNNKKIIILMQQPKEHQQNATTQLNDVENDQQQNKKDTWKRFSKWVNCFPEPLKNSFIENEESYTKWMLNNIANAAQLRDETIFSNTSKIFNE